MTAPLFLVGPGDLAAAQVGDLVELAGPEGHHAVAVTRLRPGERIDLGDGRGTVVRAVVEAVSGRERLDARVQARDVVLPPQPRLVVVQALPKGDRGETAVETLTEVGVDVIVPWQSERCIARWSGERAERGRSRWVATARAAGKQSRRAWLPEVAGLASTADVAALLADAELGIVLHEEGPVPLRDLDCPTAGEVVLVVGPEGGLSAEELDLFGAAGALVARMGTSVMRTSTAGTVAAAVLLAATDRWA
jgi:16S rRNA (uracil1498-N3)-methyltransferase